MYSISPRGIAARNFILVPKDKSSREIGQAGKWRPECRQPLAGLKHQRRKKHGANEVLQFSFRFKLERRIREHFLSFISVIRVRQGINQVLIFQVPIFIYYLTRLTSLFSFYCTAYTKVNGTADKFNVLSQYQ